MEYAYDAAGQLTARRVNGLSLTTYGYDAAGRVTTIEHDGRRALYRYDTAGRLSEKELPNGIIQRYAYSPAGDLLSIAYLDASSGEVDRIDYAYDAAGNRIRRNRTRTSSTPETLFNGVYDDANRMLSYNGYALNYDDNGNLISRETEQGPVAYSWDARGQLVAIDGPNGTARFKYDHQGRRIEKTVNGVTTGFLYDGAQAVAELAGSALGATYHTGLMIDEVLGRYAAAGDKQLLSDALGSVVGLADEGGWVSDEYAYSPFGESVHTGADERNSLGYTGREDDGTGLYYYRARYYDPGLKRFISSDPIGLLGGVNSYAYVSGNPISRIDPLGLAWYNDWHFNRNNYNEYVNQDYAQRNWEKLPPNKSIFHQMGKGNESNVKYIFSDGHSEVVFDKSGRLVTDPVNAGTYNFYSPHYVLGIPHLIVNIIPYFIWGNDENEQTDIICRISASCKPVERRCYQ
ncbi:RHS repeat domain-containing protein [Endothiovibrio diazotrophicus]